jgi:hypothetical protein
MRSDTTLKLELRADIIIGVSLRYVTLVLLSTNGVGQKPHNFKLTSLKSAALKSIGSKLYVDFNA